MGNRIAVNLGQRLVGMDVLRGIGIMGVVFIHAAMFQYREIIHIDLENPPLAVTIIGFLAMWSGMFALISGIVNGQASISRVDDKKMSPGRVARGLFLSGAVMFLLGYFYFTVLGPTLLDMDHGHHEYSLVHGLIRNGYFPPLHADRIIYNDILIMLGLNLMAMAAAAYLVLGAKGKERSKRVWMLGGVALFIILVSYVRIYLYPVFEDLLADGDPLSVFLGYIVNKHDPWLPFLGFGLFGWFSGQLFQEKDRFKRYGTIVAIFGGLVMVLSVFGLFMLPDTMLEREVDPSWYFIMLLQFGVFLLIITAAYKVFDKVPQEKRARRLRFARPLRRFGMVTFTVFLLETPVAEVWAKVWSLVYPDWNMTIGTTCIFAAFMVLFWGVVVWLWSKADFKFSVEWFLARGFRRAGRETEKDKAYKELGGRED